MSKAQNAASKKTLDTQHLGKVQEFFQKDSVSDNLQSNIEQLTEKIKAYKSKELDDTEFDKYMRMNDELNALRSQLEHLQNQDDEVDYYINTAPILFQYYDILENGKDGNSRKPVTTEKSILKYFVKEQESKEQPEAVALSNADRATLLEKYMQITDSNYIKQVDPEQKDKCPFCCSPDRVVMLNDGMIYCNGCNTVEYIIVDHERPSYRDPPKEIKQVIFERFQKVLEANPVLVACAA